jgi:hypothetical protein
VDRVTSCGEHTDAVALRGSQQCTTAMALLSDARGEFSLALGVLSYTDHYEAPDCRRPE